MNKSTQQSVCTLATQYILLGVLCTPTVYHDTLFNGIETFKTWWFLIFSGLLFISFSVNALLRPSPSVSLSINKLDIGVVLFLLYKLFNTYLQQEDFFSINNFETIGLLGVYAVSKNILTADFAAKTVKFFILITLGQIAIAVLQLQSIAPSFNSNFLITGFFFNPGPFAIFISVLSALCLSVYLFAPSRTLKISGIILFLAKLPVLWLLTSRSAWMGLLAGVALLLEFRLSWLNRASSWVKKKRVRILMVPVTLLFVAIALQNLYNLKKDSADGRLLIWKVSLTISKDHFFSGVGEGNFPAAFFKYQSAYFSKHPNRIPVEGQLAGNAWYAFNDALQFSVEHGIVRLLLFGAIICFLIRSTILVTYNQKPPASATDIHALAMGSFAAIIVLLVSGLTAYPLQVTPGNYFLYLAGSSIIVYASCYKSQHI